MDEIKTYVLKRKTLRQVLWYFFLVSVTAVFILLYSSSLSTVIPSLPVMKWPKSQIADLRRQKYPIARTGKSEHTISSLDVLFLTSISPVVSIESDYFVKSRKTGKPNDVSETRKKDSSTIKQPNGISKFDQTGGISETEQLSEDTDNDQSIELIKSSEQTVIFPDAEYSNDITKTDRSVQTIKTDQISQIIDIDQTSEVVNVDRNQQDEDEEYDKDAESYQSTQADPFETELADDFERDQTDVGETELADDFERDQTEVGETELADDLERDQMDVGETELADDFERDQTDVGETELADDFERDRTNVGETELADDFEMDDSETEVADMITNGDHSNAIIEGDEYHETMRQDVLLDDTIKPNQQNSFTQSHSISFQELISSTDSQQTTTQQLDMNQNSSFILKENETQSKTNKTMVSITQWKPQATAGMEIINNEVKLTKEDFLVYSNNCQIQNLDPFHPSIEHLIEIMDPVNCSLYSPLTHSEGNTLVINNEIAISRGITNYSCCYNVIYRDRDGKSDSKYKFSRTCYNISGEKTSINKEFIRVECRYGNATVFYREYHSFIHDKPKVEKRCKDSTAEYNVLVVGVDSMSRLNVHRQLNKTVRFLLEELDAIEMYGFNKVGDNTFPNLIPLLVGYDERELPKVCWKSSRYYLDKCDFMWNRFKQKGYRTLYAEDTPRISSFNYQKKGFARQPTDYYMRNFLLAYEDELARDKFLNCYLCLGSISQTEAILQYVEKFEMNFKNRPHFTFAWVNSLTHDFLNMGSSGDHLYEAFFRRLRNEGALNNTIIIFMSDHGMRWGKIRTTYIGLLEERLPMLFIVLPKSFQQRYSKFTTNLRENQHRLVTPFDLHATFEHILNINSEWHGIDTTKVLKELQEEVFNRSLSLFTPIPRQRSCDDARIDEHWCTCQMSFPTSLTNKNVKFVAMFLVYKINSKLILKRKLCARLELHKIKQARLFYPKRRYSSNKIKMYTITIETLPGHGVFEGTAQMDSEDIEPTLVGTISRLNLYGNQSSCVHDAILQKYCYCRNLVN